MTKIKKSPTSQPHREPTEKKTLQGQGRRSKANHGRKKTRGQGR